jgi:ATP-binding cassette subfamily B protein
MTSAAQPSADNARPAGQTTTTWPAWRVILSVIRFRPRYWLPNLGSMLFLTLMFQVPPLVTRQYFNLLTGDEPVRLGLWGIIALLFAAELGSVLGIFGLISTNVPFFVHSMTLLRKNLLKNILKRPGASALPDSPGEAISRFRGDVFEIPLFALWINDILGMVLFGIIALVVMLSISPAVTLLAICPFIIVGIVANAATDRIEKYRRASRKAAGIVTGFIGEVFGSVQAIKVATAEEGVITRFKSLNDDRRRLSLKDRLFNEILHSIFRNAVNLGTGVILVVAAQSIGQGDFTVGDLALFVFYLEFISELTAFSGLLIARYRQIGVSVERMARLMEGTSPKALVEFSPIYLDGELPQVVYPEKTDADHLQSLEATNLTFRYPDSAHGIRNIDLCIERGSFVVITGRVGSGKTTLLRTLLGLLPADEGEIRWNGRLVQDPGAFFMPPRSAYTAQVPRLFSNSLRDNILMGLNQSDEAVLGAIYQAVMEADLEDLEDGLDTLVGPKGVKLSGGQVQRTAAARMFVREPELLVFDDLSSALDVETERLLWERVFERSRATCLVVSHRRAALRHADHIVVLKDGQVEAEGRLEDLLERSEEMQRLWHGELVPRQPTLDSQAVADELYVAFDEELEQALDQAFDQALDRSFEQVLDRALDG